MDNIRLLKDAIARLVVEYDPTKPRTRSVTLVPPASKITQQHLDALNTVINVAEPDEPDRYEASVVALAREAVQILQLQVQAQQ